MTERQWIALLAVVLLALSAVAYVLYILPERIATGLLGG